MLTTNFVRCPVKACGGFPLRFENCELERQDQEDAPDTALFEALLDRIEWTALVSVMGDLGNTGFPPQRPEAMDPQTVAELHALLVGTEIVQGEMHCPQCQHLFHVKNGVANFLLPPHLAS